MADPPATLRRDTGTQLHTSDATTLAGAELPGTAQSHGRQAYTVALFSPGCLERPAGAGLRTWHRVEVRSLSKGPGAPRAELSSALRIVWSRLRVIKREVGISGPLCRHATVYVPLAVAHTAHAHCSLPMSAACMPGPHAWPRTLAPRMTATHELA